MKKLCLYSFILLTFSLFINVSCTKTSTSGPTLTVVSPLVDDSFTSGQVITIKGETSDAVKLHGLTIKITDDKTGAVLFTSSPPCHDLKTYSFDVTWTAKVSDWTDATVSIISENHDEMQTVKTVKIKIWL